MNIEVKLAINDLSDAEDVLSLQNLEAAFSNNGFDVESSKKSIPAGNKAIDIITGMTIAGLALSAIGTLISSLAYWKSTRPSYRIKIQRGGTIAEIKDVNAVELAEVVDAFSNPGGDSVTVTIDKIERS